MGINIKIDNKLLLKIEFTEDSTKQTPMGACISAVNAITNSSTASVNQPESSARAVTCEDESWLNENYDVKTLKEFIPPVKKGKVVKVYDGDTITIATRIYNDPVCKFSVRVNGIDTAEMKGWLDASKKMAILARDQLTDLIYGKTVRLENVQFEKYGRLLCELYAGDVHINRWMIENHLALEYHGDTKQSFAVWDTIYENHWKSFWEQNYNEKGVRIARV